MKKIFFLFLLLFFQEAMPMYKLMGHQPTMDEILHKQFLSRLSPGGESFRPEFRPISPVVAGTKAVGKETPGEYRARKGLMKETPAEYRARKAESCPGFAKKLEREDERRKDRSRAKQAQRREEVSKAAEALGVSRHASYESKKKVLDEHRAGERRKDHEAYLARRARYSFGTSENRSGYRIGSFADPEAAERILKDIEKTRKAGLRPSYKECLEARHAHNTLHPREYDFDRDGCP